MPYSLDGHAVFKRVRHGDGKMTVMEKYHPGMN